MHMSTEYYPVYYGWLPGRHIITGASSVDLSTAYDEMKHRLLIQKINNTTKGSTFYRHPEPAVKQKILCGAEQ